jgi:alpha-ribazole phosphatase/probable phosphoglycerate mutase
LSRIRPLRRFVDEPYPGGESWRDCVVRLRSFLDDALAEFDGRRLLVIAHSAQRFGLRHLLEGMPLEEVVDGPFAWREGWEYRIDAGLHSSG